MNDQLQQLMSNAPAWAREPAVLIGAAIVAALLLLWLVSRLFRRRPSEDFEPVVPVRAEEELPVARPITPPPVAPFPPPLAEEPLAPPPPPVIDEPLASVSASVVTAPEPAPEPAAPVASAAPEVPAEPPARPAPEPMPPVIDEAPEPAPLADEPIAAAAPFDASPASIAADAPAPEPEPVAGPDDLTRMKGVGPRLAARLNSVGVSSFAQIAALSPADADALDAQLGDFQGRIHRDRWIEQAGFLASNDVAGFESVFGKL